MNTIDTARRVRELAPSPEVAAAVRRFATDHPQDLAPFLAGALAVLEPGSVLARAEELSRKAARILAESETAPAAEVRRPCEAVTCTKASSREEVLRYCRERLGLREDGDESWRGQHIGTYEDREEDGEVWVFFRRRPQADVRAKMKDGGFWYMGKPTYGWRHHCGAGKERTS